MPEIIKTNAFVLKKLNYGDSSKIATFYTRQHGKISGIIKGARSPKSKMGAVVDVLNHVEIVFYQKASREVQLVSEATLIDHYPNIKSDLDALKYASAVAELLLNLTPEYEEHPRLFAGTERIFKLFDSSSNDNKLLFVKYMIFFIKEIGFELQLEYDSLSGEKLSNSDVVYYNYENGFFTAENKSEHLVIFEFSKELFNLLLCLSKKIDIPNYRDEDLNKIIFFLEKFLSYHTPNFKGLRSLQTY
jgi:DNA repair protein RecO (recombination protein O)